MSKSLMVQKRTDLLCSELVQRKGERIFFSDLEKLLNEKLPGDKRKPSSLKYSLERAKSQIQNDFYGTAVTIGRDYVVVNRNDQTIFDQRMHHNVQQKRAIASAFWHWLFGFELRHAESIECRWEGTSLESRIARSRIQLRSKISLGMVIDAGSTNTLLTQEFLDTINEIPFDLVPDQPGVESNPRDPFSRLISPIVVTNSTVIADRIGRSKHRHSLTLRIIGGTESPDRRSICGELSLLWLRACHSEGIMVSLDLAVVGCTGINYHTGTVPKLGCEIPEEGSLKSRFLAMSQFRVVTLDSSKLIGGSSNSLFCSISGGDIDLLVTNSGANEEEEKALNSLNDECRSNGVGLLVANMPLEKQ